MCQNYYSDLLSFMLTRWDVGYTIGQSTHITHFKPTVPSLRGYVPGAEASLSF